MGINIGREFKEMTCNFLNCSECTIPFMYLGLPVWTNPKNGNVGANVGEIFYAFEYMGEQICESWGRTVLINSVLLNWIPTFLFFLFLSFLHENSGESLEEGDTDSKGIYLGARDGRA